MTIFEAYNTTKQRLKKVGIEDYVFEAKEIIKAVTGLNASQILTLYNKRLSEYEENNLTAVIHQREIRYPLQYIFGRWDFYGRSFFVGPGVLVPRADTETLVDEALDYLKGINNPKILDLCAGSGCIGITLSKEIPESEVYLVEKYDEALNYLNKNIRLNNCENVFAVKGDIFEGALNDKEYDLIVSNPPYIPKKEMEIISPETRFEPETALLAEDDGLQFYKAIVKRYTPCLKKGGMLAFEFGIDQAGKIEKILKTEGFTDIKIKKDLNGKQRVITGIRAEE